MRLANPQDLGLYIRDQRKSLGLSQADLAAEASVSRRFLIDLERGKPTAEIGLVFKVMHSLRLTMEASTPAKRDVEFDLDDIIREHSGPDRSRHDR